MNRFPVDVLRLAVRRPRAPVAALLLIAAGCATPSALRVRGRLTDVKGAPQNGSYYLTFKLFTPGNDAPDWMESQYIKAEAGDYTAVLGERNPLPTDLLKSNFRIAAEPIAGTGWVATTTRVSRWSPPAPKKPAPEEKPKRDSLPGFPDRSERPIASSRRLPPSPDFDAPGPRGASAPEAGGAESVQAQDAEIERLQKEVTLLRQMVLNRPAGKRKQAAEAGDRAPEPPRVYRVKAGDTLLTISQQLYGTPDRWMDLYQANADRIQRGGDLSEDQVLVLP